MDAGKKRDKKKTPRKEDKEELEGSSLSEDLFHGRAVDFYKREILETRITVSGLFAKLRSEPYLF
ncbi:MAG: hypothetical protein K8I29_04130 [Alphaproteobacteria bacterium]|uniref:Uncharacterized protein n=1 Tax=Candidatus Nitrobium versatile TaxID=2884831 RepID=A0A953M1C5_9BACT|nr:hypothetical protein [Candidatus Nitrobium versatile]